MKPTIEELRLVLDLPVGLTSELLPLCLIVLSTACGSDPSGAIDTPVSVDSAPVSLDAGPDAWPANCSLDEGKYATRW